MPEVAAVAKLGASCEVSKQSLTKITKKQPMKQRKSYKQNYSTYAYRGLTRVHLSTRIPSKAMSVMNSFVVNVFERIASEASLLINYNIRHTTSAREIQSTSKAAVKLELVAEAMKKRSWKFNQRKFRALKAFMTGIGGIYATWIA
ncbi:histone H2B-like [Carcharodon carcharias]|uniref:histone H2B-like n=1 Tax=Carcharodon carcharias TaxID=13397 RepID=UPI001B7E6D0A|nr:histone H2B-like [Carcharodon carcharias]